MNYLQLGFNQLTKTARDRWQINYDLKFYFIIVIWGGLTIINISFSFGIIKNDRVNLDWIILLWMFEFLTCDTVTVIVVSDFK